MLSIFRLSASKVAHVPAQYSYRINVQKIGAVTLYWCTRDLSSSSLALRRSAFAANLADTRLTHTGAALCVRPLAVILYAWWHEIPLL